MAFKGLRFAGLEWKNITASKVMWVVIGAIAIMPLLYGALYLAAFQDPYARLNTVPVAVVNEDRGAVIAGENRNLGDDVVDELKGNDDGLGWNFVSAEEAQKGLEDGAYFMTCTIPSDFSESVASVDSSSPEKAQLKVEYNQSENMLASQIGETVWKEVRQRVSDTVATEYWTTVLNRVADSGKDLQTAADGAGTLEDGLVAAQDGSQTIAENLGTLKNGALSLEEGLDVLANGALTLKGGTSSLVSGASELKNGASQVANGANELEQQTADLPSKTGQLNDGVQQVVGSMKALATSIGPDDSQSNQELIGGVNLVSTGLDQVSAGASMLGSRLGEASDGLSHVRGGIASVNTNAQNALAVLDGSASETEKLAAARRYLEGIAAATDSSSNLAQGVDSVKSGLDRTDPANPGAIAAANGIASQTGAGSSLQNGLSGIKGGLSTARANIENSQPQLQALSDGALQLAQKSSTLVGGISRLASGADQVDAGASSAVSGAGQLDSGAGRLSDGAQSAKGGSSQLASGASQLEEGGAALASGLTDAVDGSGELAERLAEGAQTAADQTSNVSGKADVMSDPVELANDYYTTVKNYGTGFAPYFMALGLWVGGLVAGFVFKPLNGRLIMSGAHPVTVAFSNFLPVAFFSIIQATLLMVVLQFGLQLQIDNVPAFYAMGYLTAIVFAAIMQVLMAAFGFPGKFVAIILLMLQLTACAGTFPIQTTPDFFQAINPFMPMTYVVSGMRQIMTGLDYGIVGFDCFVLFAIGAVCFVLTCLVAYRKRTVRMDDLHPVLQLG